MKSDGLSHSKAAQPAHRGRPARPARRRRPAVGMVAIGMGIILSAVATWHASSAVFTATTTNGANNFSTGNVALVDNDSNSVMFNITGMKPGSTGQSCITVTYNGSLAAGVRLYGTSESATNSLDGQINLQIEESTASATFGTCAGFTSPTSLSNGTLAAFAAANTQYSNGLSSWAPTGSGQLRSYRFTYTLSSSAPNSVMSSTAAITFTWEAQNT